MGLRIENVALTDIKGVVYEGRGDAILALRRRARRPARRWVLRGRARTTSGRSRVAGVGGYGVLPAILGSARVGRAG